MKYIKDIIFYLILALAAFLALKFFTAKIQENKMLKAVIAKLEADTRVAEVLVTEVSYDETDKKIYTTIKFLEYDADNKPLIPKYFTFKGNIIQFQSLVVRFEDVYVKKGDRYRGKSAYFFWKVFMLDGPDTQEYDITSPEEVPEGYRVEKPGNKFEEKLWANVWKYVKDRNKAGEMGVKNVQIEAPGTMFVPGVLYTIKIEHDGGMRIDTDKLSPILQGETIPENV